MRIFIYSGIPGAGKSTLIAQRHVGATVCSADHYTDSDDSMSVLRAEAACLRKFVEAVQAQVPEVVVDNTNCSAYEIAPYAALALAYGYALKVLTLRADPLEVAERNVHGVRFAIVCGMAERLAKRELPPWWPQEDVVVHA